MKCVLLFSIVLFCSNISSAQERSTAHHQIFVEFLGNNFFDSNTQIEPGWASVNYGRTCFSDTNSWVFSAGLSFAKGTAVDTANNVLVRQNAFLVPVGFLWKRGRPSNGIWLGLYLAAAIGDIQYNGLDNNGHARMYQYPVSFVVSPDIAYQLQTKSGKLFCRISFSPKIQPSLFSPKFGYGDAVCALWAGLSIGFQN